MYILGISAYYHDSAAALIKDGEIVAAAQEERFTRKKNDPSFPHNAIGFCLSQAGILISQVAFVVFYDKPFLKFERILEIFYRYAPMGFKQFLTGMPVWIKEKMFFKQMLHKELKKHEGYDRKKTKLLFTEHHVAHASSAFFVSPFKEATIVTVDGVGEWTTLSISTGKDNTIEILKEMYFPDSVGLLYSSFTYYLGFEVNEGEYKLMGLAPYGVKEAEETIRFIRLIENKMVTIFKDGSISLEMSYFNYHKGTTMVNEKKWDELFGMKKRSPDDEITLSHCHLALAIQSVTEKILLKIVREAKRLTGLPSLCLAGGVALNCVANGKINRQRIVDPLFIQPAAGDAGGALGAALSVYYMYLEKNRTVYSPDQMKGALLGPSFTDREVEVLLKEKNVRYRYFTSLEELCEITAGLLSGKKCIGWFQGRMEFGPRALGNRSILADPRDPDMQKRLNLKIKFRESFRPFAPAILKERANDYFESLPESDYMLLTTHIREAYRQPLPYNYPLLSVQEKLATERSLFQAITHVDYSSRLQTVDKRTNVVFWTLLSAFERLTGCPMLINTSFNVKGEPIVCSPEDAYQCFINTGMDYLVINNFLLSK